MKDNSQLTIIGNKFLLPTKNILDSSYSIIESFILYDKELKKAYQVDGNIIGTGQADYTKDVDIYDFKYKDKEFNIIDMPGIEGNEGKFEKLISEALAKSHFVFYVHGTNKPLEVGIVEKIKKYLGDNSSIYSILNLKGKPDSYEFEEDRVSLVESNKDTLKIADKISEGFLKIFDDDIYKGCIVVQGLISFSSVAYNDGLSTIDTNKDDLIKYQKKFLSFFNNTQNMRDFSCIDNIVSIIDKKIDTFEEEIKRSNINKILFRVDDFLNKITEKEKNYSEIVDKTNNHLKHTTDILNTYHDNFILELERGIYNSIDKFFDNFTKIIVEKISNLKLKLVQKKVRSELESSLINESQKLRDELQKDIEDKVQKLSDEYNKKIKTTIERFKKDFDNIFKYNEILKNINIDKIIQTNFQNLIGDISLNFKKAIDNLIMRGISFFLFPPDTLKFVIISIVSILVDLGLDIRTDLNADRLKEKVQRKINKKLEKDKKEIKEKLKEELINKIVVGYDKYKLKCLEEINSFYDKECYVLSLLQEKIKSFKNIKSKLKDYYEISTTISSPKRASKEFFIRF